MWHAWERGQKYTGFRRESLKDRDRSEDRGIDRRMGSKRISRGLSGRCELDSAGSDTDRWRAVVNTATEFGVMVPRSWLIGNVGGYDELGT
jgi:hypothetical protein